MRKLLPHHKYILGSCYRGRPACGGDDDYVDVYVGVDDASRRHSRRRLVTQSAAVSGRRSWAG